MTQDKAFKEFLDAHVRVVQPLEKELNLASWDAATTGSEEAEARTEKLDVEYQTVYANPDSFAALKAMAAGPWEDPLLERQHRLLLDGFTGSQIDAPTIEKMAALETKLRTIFNTHRSKVGGKELSDNEVKDILRESDDSALRQEAWEASKSIGPRVKPDLMTLIDLRNDAARKLGFSDYYTMRITLEDLDVERVFAILGELEKASDAPWDRVKGALDAKLAKRFGITVEELRPWHYQDPFFQDAPASAADLDDFYPGKDLEPIARQFFGDMGLPAEGILERSDLYERPGKNQHAFCTDIDRAGDIRTLCNLRPTAGWMGTLCHELGHGVYDEGLDPHLPWLLHNASHGLMTESIAILMEFFPRKGAWLKKYVEAAPEAADRADALSAREQAVADLTITRWFLVMCNFERALYADPSQDVDTLWWDMVERYQKVNRPDNRHAPDWCAKIHLALYPVYYHLYPLGSCVASQWRHIIRQRFPDAAEGLGDPGFGEFLRKEVFAPGKSLPWEDLLERASGERLTTKHWAEEWATAV